jgi:hypothetical protein
MYYNDHLPPHFHAEYAETECVFSIDTLEMLRGGLPRRAQGMVLEWAAQHRDELRENWQLAREMEPLNDIAPLE